MIRVERIWDESLRKVQAIRQQKANFDVLIDAQFYSYKTFLPVQFISFDHQTIIHKLVEALMNKWRKAVRARGVFWSEARLPARVESR